MPQAPAHPYRTALALALGAAVSLGLARFSYALLLPPMRDNWGWSYFVAGAMNTVNACGYLVGALAMPFWLAKHDARHVMVVGMAATALLLGLHAVAPGDATLMMLRALTGVASAATFVSGGLLAARLGSPGASTRSSSLLLGLYYGGTGGGIVASALIVPAAMVWTGWGSGWRAAWLALALASACAAWGAWCGTAALASTATQRAVNAAFEWRAWRFGLLAYLMFGLGYIGYMTFVVTLLRQSGLDAATITLFYVVLGFSVMASPWLWAGLLQRHRGGVPIAVLNGLLALATVLPVVSTRLPVVLVSGALFGGVFLSVVASTTAMVRHNLQAPSWTRGIAAFTAVFAAGQIVGPGLVGWVADGAGGLQRGFVLSAAVLALGSVFGLLQRPLTPR